MGNAPDLLIGQYLGMVHGITMRKTLFSLRQMQALFDYPRLLRRDRLTSAGKAGL